LIIYRPLNSAALLASRQTGVSGSTCQFDSRLSVMNISQWRNIDGNSELALQEAVALIGPVSAALDTSSEEFQVGSEPLS